MINYKKLYSGEHLKRIDPNWTFEKWSYKHTFIAKMKYIDVLLSKVPTGCRILDVGCGQGLLVKEFKRKGFDIVGIDKFYSNEDVIKEDIFDNSFEDNSFDLILCLDVIEHFNFDLQEKLIMELTRILKPKGKLIFSIPNLAHLSSRVMFLFTGNLLRTAKISYHPGDRPIKEYLKIIQKYLKVEKKEGISATIPGLFQLTQLFPQYTGWLYWLLKPFNIIWGWCFNVVIISRKKLKN